MRNLFICVCLVTTSFGFKIDTVSLNNYFDENIDNIASNLGMIDQNCVKNQLNLSKNGQKQLNLKICYAAIEFASVLCSDILTYEYTKDEITKIRELNYPDPELYVCMKLKLSKSDPKSKLLDNFNTNLTKLQIQNCENSEIITDLTERVEKQINCYKDWLFRDLEVCQNFDGSPIKVEWVFSLADELRLDVQKFEIEKYLLERKTQHKMIFKCLMKYIVIEKEIETPYQEEDHLMENLS